MRKHRRPTNIRQTVPLFFYAACLVLAVAGLWWQEPLMCLTLPTLYVVALLAAGAGAVPQNGPRVSAYVPLAMAAMHAGYALGTLHGVWAGLFWRDPWNAQGKMSAITR